MTSCPSCGAAVRADATRCPLCGTDLADLSPADEMASIPDAPPGEASPPAVAALRGEPAACAACGHVNPAAARFCNDCGATLAAAVPAQTAARRVQAATGPVPGAPGTVDRPASAAGRRALVLVGLGVAAVVGLYAVTARSGAPADPTPASASAVSAPGSAAAGTAAAVPDGPTPPLADSLQRAADALEAQNTASGWYEAGRYYLTAGFDAQQAGDAQSTLWIRRAMADFEKSLAIEENPDVRFALAESSQFDPADPMRPVLELRTLLAATPNHIGGNFLLGERRMLIGRLDSARVSFERVVALAPPDDPLRARAAERLVELAQPGAATRGVPDGAGAPPPAGTPAAPPSL